MADTFTFDFTFEPEIDGFCIGSFDCRAHVEVTDLEADDWFIDDLEVMGVKHERPHAGDLTNKRVERYFSIGPGDPYFIAMKAEAERIAPEYICAAYNSGEIGPAARAAALADYRRDMAEAD